MSIRLYAIEKTETDEIKKSINHLGIVDATVVQYRSETSKSHRGA